jgi:glycosyltransferase involved in cell wall biosynthesis
MKFKNENNFVSRRITNIVSSLDNPAAGTTYSVRELCAATAAAGYGVEILVLAHPEKNGTVPPMPAVKISEFPVMENFGKTFRRLGYSREMFDYIKNNPPRLLHLHGLWMLPNITPGLIAIKQQLPYMISPHGMLGREALRFSPRKKRLMLALGQQKVLSNATCFRATALSEVEEIRALGMRQPIALVPNGIHLPEGSWQKTGEKYLLSLGRVHPKKGLANLIKAWAKQANAFPDWKLRIVGPDEVGHKAELSKLVTQIAVPRVTIEDPVFGDAKWSLMAAAGLFVLPTLNENFANTVPESLISGVPVISSKGAPWVGLKDHRCGWWVDGDVDSLSATLAQAMALSDEERAAMGLRGREWMIRDFAWSGIGQRVAAVYNWMLGEGSATDDIIFD